jgi:hypothetical protein
MCWSKLWFGRHKGKTLPQVVFKDPDWFFWAVGAGIFKKRGRLLNEAKEIYRKSQSIRIPKNGSKKLVVEYFVHPSTEKFACMEIVPASRPDHVGSSDTFRSEVIDLSVLREISSYDKLGGNLLISNLKYYLFGSSSYRMTKARCEAFFEDDGNFDL